MTWVEAKISEPSSSTNALSLLTQYAKSAAGSPVNNRTRTDVSIPKRRIMDLIAEGFEIERAAITPDLAT